MISKKPATAIEVLGRRYYHSNVCNARKRVEVGCTTRNIMNFNGDHV